MELSSETEKCCVVCNQSNALAFILDTGGCKKNCKVWNNIDVKNNCNIDRFPSSSTIRTIITTNSLTAQSRAFEQTYNSRVNQDLLST
jgi:hypothetical protein